MKLHPFNEVVQRADELIAQGAVVHQQFNCATCGTKQIMEERNKFFTFGNCEECGRQTNIERDGCNFLVIFEGTPDVF